MRCNVARRLTFFFWGGAFGILSYHKWSDVCRSFFFRKEVLREVKTDLNNGEGNVQGTTGTKINYTHSIPIGFMYILVYSPTFKLIFMINAGKYTIHGWMV